MAVDVGVLRAVLTLDTSPYRRELAGVGAATQAQLGRLTAAAGALRGMVAGVVSALAVREVFQFLEGVARTADQVRLLQARLQELSGSAAVFGAVVESADRLGVSIDAAAQSLQRFLIARREIGLSVQEAIRLNEVVLMLGRISGASVQELSAASLQLAQALAAGRLQGDELRSVMENLPALARVLADQLGVSVGQLRELGAQGRLTGEIVARALLEAADRVEERFRQLPQTFEQATSRLSTAWSRFVEALDRELGVSRTFTFFTEELARAIDNLREALAGPEPGSFAAAREIVELDRQIRELEGRLARLRALPQVWPIPQQVEQAERQLAALVARQNELLEASRRAAREAGGTAEKPEKPEKPPKPSVGLPPTDVRIPPPPVPRQAVLAEAAGEVRIELERRLAELQRERLELEIRLQNVGVEGVDRLVAAKLREAEVRELLSGITDEETRKLAERYLREAEAVDALNERLAEQARAAAEVQRVADAVGDAFARAFMDMATGARSAQDAITALAAEIAALTTRRLIADPLSSAVSKITTKVIDLWLAPGPGGSLSVPNPSGPGGFSIGAVGPGGLLGHAARGAVIDAGRIVPFAKGGVVDRPTLFPLRGGAGLMGEAGPEAVLPLTRTRSGELGVRALADDAVRPVEVVVQVVDQRSAEAPPLDVRTSRLGQRRVIDVVVEDSLRRLWRSGRISDLWSTLEGGRPAAR